MKNKVFFALLLISLLCLGVFSCDKKKSSGITPTYGTTGNPNPNNPTVTGATTYTNPATENTSLLAGGSGWSNPTCGSTGSLSLKANNGETDITLTFASAIQSGTYSIASKPASNVCALSIVNAPNQPAGIVWQGKNGTVVVNTTSTSITAILNNISCTQATFNFPVVTVNGVIGCSQ